MLGILLIDKPAGITSHDVVNRVRRRFHLRRVGHAGTLDPQATGLLVVAVGPATRFLQYLPLEPKEYEGEITFGIETNTQDAEGEVVAEKPVPKDLEFEFDYALPRFKGLIEQLPPLYSAVKKAGKPLYHYARKGEDVERDLRTVHIGEVELLAIEGPIARFRVVCSGGTYVRTWAHDIGQAIGCGAHLSALRRTKVGKFIIEDAVALDDVEPEHLITLAEALSPPTSIVDLNQHQTDAIRQGQAVGMGRSSWSGVVGLRDPQGRVIGMAQAHGAELQPECVIPLEAIL